MFRRGSPPPQKTDGKSHSKKNPPLSSREAVFHLSSISKRNRLQVRIQHRIHLLKRLADEEHRVERIDRLGDLGDRLDVKRSQYHFTAKIPIVRDTQLFIKRVNDVPARLLRRHLSFLMQFIDTSDDTADIFFVRQVMTLKLLEYIGAVIEYIVPAQPVKFHDRIREFTAT